MGRRPNHPDVGSVLSSNSFGDFLILGYEIKPYGNRDRKMVKIKFVETDYETFTEPYFAVKGLVRDPFYPKVYGKGFIGSPKPVEAKHKKCHEVWQDMFYRCYGNNVVNKRLYKDVKVCEEWHNFQNFIPWFEDNYIEGYRLDKDLKILDSKLYSPETCTFVPHRVNSFVTNRLKVGVSYCSSNDTWKAQCANNGHNHQIGNYKSKELAVEKYKNFKLRLLSELRDEYPEVITDIIFNNIVTMINRL